MNNEIVIGIDSSTTGVKVIAFNKKGQIIAQAHENIQLFSPQSNYYEQNANDWWMSAKKALKTITKQVGPERIIGLGISNQRETFVPLDRKGESIRPAILWLDERCKDEVESFAQKIGRREIHRVTGKPVDYAPVVYRLAWMKKHQPALYKKIHRICDVHTYLVWKFTETYKTSWASADPMGLLDLKNKKWSDAILKELELNEEQLPQIYRPGVVLGKICKKAIKETGLNENTVIVAGGGDGQAAGLGTNVLTQERAYLNLGTAVVAGIYGEEYKTDNAFRTLSSCAEKGYYYECSLRAGTFAIDWFIKNLLKIDPLQKKEIYKQLENEAQQVPAGSDGLIHLPYLCGVMNPYWDSNARGAFIGLSASHTRGHIYRSILEGIAFEQLVAINAVEQTTSSAVNDLIAIGGGASSQFWCQIFADITGKRICIPHNLEASCLGAAIAASVGVGWYQTFKEAANEMTSIEKDIKPNILNHHTYNTIFEVYKNIYPGIKKL